MVHSQDGMQERIGPIPAPRILPAPTHTFRAMPELRATRKLSVGLVPTNSLGGN